MKIGNIAKTNDKGQVVIPRELRAELGITEDVLLNVVRRGNTICMYPVSGVLGVSESDEGSYLNILQKTRGTWKNEQWTSLRKKRKAIERVASSKRKKSW